MDELERALVPTSERIVPQHQQSVLFLAQSWVTHLELIEHLSHYSSHLLLVLGPALAGKTSFLELFLQRDTPGLFKQKITLGKGDSPSQILANLDPHKTILLVDNAEKASDEMLLTLLKRSCAYDSKEGIHVVFFATQGFEVRLIQPLFLPYIQGRVHSIEMEPFSLEEATTFLSRAQFEGQGLVPPNEQQIRTVFAQAGGFPGRMLQLARLTPRRTFLSWLPSLSLRRGRPLRERPLVWVLVVGVFFIGCFMWIALQEPKTTRRQLVLMPMGKGLGIQDSQKREEMIEPLEPEKPLLGYGPEPHLLPLPSEAVANAEASLPYTVKVEEAVAPAPLALASEPMLTEPETLQTAKEVTPVSPAIQNPSIALKVAPKGKYTVQILSAGNEKNIQRFIEQYDLKEAHYVKSLMKGRPWYILSYGAFSSKEQAQAALRSLPKEVRALKPWVRRSE